MPTRTFSRQPTAAGVAASAPPATFFVGSAVFHYLGPAFAVLLFARLDVLGVAWLRIASAAVIFALWRKPWRRIRMLDRPGVMLLLALGTVLGVMNCVFYLAIDRLPLGTVAAIEFVGPIVLAVVGARSLRNALALTLAVPGVYILTGLELAGEPLGIAFAFANAALFMLYIILGHRLARRSAMGGIDGLAVAMAIALVVATRSAVGSRSGVHGSGRPGSRRRSRSHVVRDPVCLRPARDGPHAPLDVRVAPRTPPGDGDRLGVIVLAQIPTAVEIVGVALIVLGVAVHRERAAKRRLRAVRGLSCGAAGMYGYLISPWRGGWALSSP